MRKTRIFYLKRINLKDLNGDILLHDDIGIGPEYINYERKLKDIIKNTF